MTCRRNGIAILCGVSISRLIFLAPLLTERDLAHEVLERLLDLKIDLIMEVKFEWPTHGLNPLGDHTSMDGYMDMSLENGMDLSDLK